MTDDKCGATNDDHQVLIKVEYDVKDDGDGGLEPSAASIHSHVHNVPTEVAAQTLVIIAVKMLADHMAHDMFEGMSDHTAAHAMGTAASKAFLTAVLHHLPDSFDLLSVAVPDDLSELLGEGNN